MTTVGEAMMLVRPDSTGFGSTLEKDVSGHVKRVAGLVGAALGGLGVAAFIKSSLAEAQESIKVNAQTNAVLKSTGGAAHIAAAGVDELANSISRKTGIDDEAIAANENLLLTFTNVRNEAGKGNDIFNQATQAVTDMSVALGQDGKSSAIQLGKALNDPIKGITALQRVGVSFTKQQKDQITTLVKGGHTLEAQKMILAEINKEFGGSAAAAATPIDKLRVTMKNLEETVGKLVIPVLNKLATFLVVFIPDATKAAGRAWDSFLGGFQNPNAKIGPGVDTFTRIFLTIGSAVRTMVDVSKGPLEAFYGDVRDLFSFIQDHKGVQDIILGIVGAITGLIIAEKAAGQILALESSIKQIGDTASHSFDSLKLVGSQINQLKSKTVSVTVNGAKKAADAVQSIVDNTGKLANKTVSLTLDIKQKGGDAASFGKSFVNGIAGGVAGAIGGAVAAVIAAAGTAVIVPALIAIAVLAVGALIITFHKQIFRFFALLPHWFVEGFQAVGRWITTTLPHLLGEAIGIALGALVLYFVGIPVLIVQGLIKGVPKLINAGIKLGEAIVKGLLSGLEAIGGALETAGKAVVDFVTKLPGMILRELEALPGQILNIFINLPQTIGTVVLAVGNFFANLPGMILGFIQGIPAMVGGIFAAIGNFISQHFQGIISAITGFFGSIWQGIQDGWNMVNEITGGALNAVTSTISGWISGILGFFAGIGGAIAKAASGMWNGIKTAASAVFDTVKGWLSGIGGWFAGIPKSIAKAASGMFDGIKDAFKGAINWVIRAWNKLEFKIPGFDPPGPGPKFGGFTLGMPNIKELAEGGIVKARRGGTAVIVGEGGDDEAVIPLKPGMKGGAPNVTNNYNNYFGAPTMSPQEYIQAQKTLQFLYGNG